MKKIALSFLLFAAFFQQFTLTAHAHEAYVLTQDEFSEGLHTTTTNPLAPLFSPDYIGISAIITIAVVVTYLLALLFSSTSLAKKMDKYIRKLKDVGLLVVRLALSASFFYGAMGNSMFGPELSLNSVAGGEFIRVILFALAFMITFGFLTEVAALIGLALLLYFTTEFGLYMITYANYFGELLVLILFGSRFLSIDKYLFGVETWISKLKKFNFLEVPIVRITYGIGLIFAGWEIKFAHQILAVEVYNKYHLENFFHAPASFIAAGAGLSEIAIGVFILLGFFQRITIFISLIFITLSLLYFREMLWPHFMLYGISISLLINSADKFTLDKYVVPWVKKLRKKL